MPVFHFTLHAYRSWNADHPLGYVERGEAGVKATNLPLAEARKELARFEEVRFDAGQADAADGSRFTFRYEAWGRSDTVDGQVNNDGSVDLKTRHRLVPPAK